MTFHEAIQRPGQVWLGSTPTTQQPFASALYSRKPLSCAKLQECSRRLAFK